MERTDKRSNSDNLYDQTWKNLINETRGQRKGQLWRDNSDWYAPTKAGQTGEQLNKRLKLNLQHVEEKIKTQKNKGWSDKKTLKYEGSIPFEIFLAHPELWYDDAATDKFLKDNPRFSVKHHVPAR